MAVSLLSVKMFCPKHFTEGGRYDRRKKDSTKATDIATLAERIRNVSEACSTTDIPQPVYEYKRAFQEQGFEG